MANVFDFGPMGVSPSKTVEGPETPQARKSRLESIATKSNVPANLLMALEENGAGSDLEGLASKLSAEIKSGKKIESIVPASVLNRAYDIADTLYPRATAPASAPEGGMLAAASSGIDSMQQGFGSAIEGAGKSLGLEGIEKMGAGIAERNAREAEENGAGLTRLSDVDGIGSGLKYAGEITAQNAPQMGASMAAGMAGAATGAALGSVIPVIGTAAGAIVGGIAGGLTVNLPLFYGQNRERQKEAIEAGIGTEIDEGAAALAAIPQAALDTIVDRFIVGKFLNPKVVESGGLLTKAALKRAGQGATQGIVSEVPTEIGQSILERYQAGLPLDDDEAIAEYIEAGVAGGILGGGMGAATRAMDRGEAPNPDAGDGGSLPRMDGGIDPLDAPDGGIPPLPTKSPIAPTGPIGRAAANAPDLTPVAEPEALPPMFPDQKAGAPVRLVDPETGEILEGVFQREEEGNAIVRIGGEEVDIHPKLFDEMTSAARALDEPIKKKKGAKSPAPAAPISSLPEDFDNPSAFVAGDSPLPPAAAQPAPAAPPAAAQPAPPVATQPVPADDPLANLTPEEAQRRLDNVNARIAKAKTPKKNLLELKGKLEGIASGAGNQDKGVVNNAVQQSDDNGRIYGGERALLDEGSFGGGMETGDRGVEGGGQLPEAPASSGAKDLPDATSAANDFNPVSGPSIPPVEREQADMFGGPSTNEAAMALKEKTKKQWGRFLAISESGSSSDDMELDGRDVVIRPSFFIVRAKRGGRSDQDRRVDTTGMSRDEIAAAARGAMNELSRISAFQQAAPSPAAPIPAPAQAKPLPSAAEFEAAAAETDPEPTAAQAEAENYATGKIDYGDFKLSIENRKGSVRSKKTPDGQTEWSVTMPAHYGRILGTKGADGDHIDFYMGDEPDAQSVFVIDQMDAETGKFDEHKVMLGFSDQAKAMDTYRAGFSDGKGDQRMGGVSQMSPAEFKEWSSKPVTKPAAAPVAPAPAAAPAAPAPAPAPAAPNLSISNIRERAAVLRGLPKDAAPAIDGVSLKWDEKEKGFIFSRAKTEKVKSALGMNAEDQADGQRLKTKEEGRKAGEAWARAGKAETRLEDPAMGNSNSEAQGGWTAGYRKTKISMDKEKTLNQPMKDMTKLDFDAWDDQTREDGQNSPAKREAFAETKRWLSEILDRLNANGFSPVMDQKGKKLPAISKSYAMSSEPDEERMEAMTPDGNVATVSVTSPTFLGEGLSVKVTFREPDQKGQRGKSIGFNEYINPKITPSEASEQIERLAARADRTAAAVREKANDAPKANTPPKDMERAGRHWDGLINDQQRALIKDTEGTPDVSGMKWEKLNDLTKSRLANAMPERAFATTNADILKAAQDSGKLEIVHVKQKSRDAAQNFRDNYAESGTTDLRRNPDLSNVADYADWLGSLTDAQWETLKADFRNMDNPYLNAGFIDVDASRANLEAVLAEAGGKAKPSPRSEVSPPPVTPKPSPSKVEYGSQNTLVSKDRAAELRLRLQAKLKDQLNAGIDPEILAIGAELAVFHIEAGARRFADLARAISDDLGTTPAKIRPYLRSWYNGARDMMEDADLSIDGMDGPDVVRSELAKIVSDKSGESTVSQNDVEPANIEGETSPTDEADEQRANQNGDQEELGDTGTQQGLDGEPSPDAGRRSDGGGEGDEDAARNGAGNEPAGGVDGSPKPVPSSAVGPVSNKNFTFGPNDSVGAGTAGEKLAANMEALRIVRKLELENRGATEVEQAALAKWVGWGGLSTVFDTKHKSANNQWGNAQRELKMLLSSSEYYAAMRSTNDAHFTARPVVEAMWQAMKSFGFNGGRALEPTIGSGNFLSLQPSDISDKTEWFASELDPITGKISKYLFPKATIFDGQGFQSVNFKAGSFDIAIGNPPFGSTKIGDAKLHPDLGEMKVHNFIIAKTGQSLREGGIMGMVVTHRFLDAIDPEARKILTTGFKFLGAVRLPNDAFKANAGTEVTTDIVFFQKDSTASSSKNDAWTQVKQEGPNGTILNGYFAKNPDMILGRAAMDGTMYAGRGNDRAEFTVHSDGRDIGEALSEALAKIKASLPSRTEALEDATVQNDAASDISEGRLGIMPNGTILRGTEKGVEEVTADSLWKDGADAEKQLSDSLTKAFEQHKREGQISSSLRQKIRNAAVDTGFYDLAGDPIEQTAVYAKRVASAIKASQFSDMTPAHLDAVTAYAKRVDSKRLGAEKFQRLKAILSIREKTKALIKAERKDAPNVEDLRADLARSYQSFVEKNGFLNSANNEALLRGDIGVEMSLEVKFKPAKKGVREESASPSAILSKRIYYPHKMPDSVDSVSDGIHVSIQERGFVDPELIAKLTGEDLESVISELTGGANPIAFKDPKTGRYEIADAYLSGNLAEKIEIARAARAFENIPHLKAAMPPAKTSEQITPSIRSMWIPAEVYNDFMRAIGIPDGNVSIHEKTGQISTTGDLSAAGASEFGKQFVNTGMALPKIFDHAVRGKIPVVFDYINKKPVKNEARTREAVAAYERMANEFQKWAFASPERTDLIVDAFNTKVNVVTRRNYDGVKYLRTVGTSPEISLRNSQKNGAWRMIQDSVVLLHHVVGAGKTMTGITGVMERKRMGLTRKAVVVVPNHLTGQWGKEWLELYPAANILVPTEKDFEPANRARLINNIATGDYDAVIIGHSQLVKIANDDEIVEKYINDELDDLHETLQTAREDGSSSRTVKQIGARIDKLKEKLKKAQEKSAERSDDAIMPWRDLGVDYMLLDEAQEFKNLEYSTTATQLVGMNPQQGSQKASDLLMKIRSIQEMQNGGVTMMTGTPISNSLVEIYSLMKYMIPDSLAAMNIKHFDAWKAAFIKDESRFEYTASMQLKERNVMSGMINLGPLAELYRSFADIVMRPDVERMYTEQMEAKNKAEPDQSKHVSTRFPTPKIKDGGRRILLAPPTQMMQEFTRYLVMRMNGIKKAPNKREYVAVDNPLWVLTDARKASVDIRTIDPIVGREQGSKVVRSSDEVYRIWKASEAVKGTQLVFDDLSTPSKFATKEAVRVIKEALTKLGITGKEQKAHIEASQGKSYAEQWGDLVGMLEDASSSADTPQARVDSISRFMETAAYLEASASMQTADTGFSFYDDMRSILIEKGIPEDQIAFIHDYNTTDQKRDLFDAVNAGRVRVLLGSTMKMGAGTNAQKRMVALHHIDAPWRPSDMEQREGRIIRQGNELYEADPEGFEVEILAYSTEKTSDVVQWQVLVRKATGIESFLNAAADTLIEEGGDADQYADFMAQSTGRKVFLEKMNTEKELERARAAISNSILLRSEAKSFIERYDVQRGNHVKTRDQFSKLSEKSFPDGSDGYLSGFNAQNEAHRIAKDKYLAEAEAIREGNKDLPRAQWKRLPDAPTAPKRWPDRPNHKWEQAVYDALVDATNKHSATGAVETIALGEGFTIEVTAYAVEGGIYSYSVALVYGDFDISLTGGMNVTAKDFRASNKLLAAFDPSGVLHAAKEEIARRDRMIDRLDERLPQMKKDAATDVDTSKVSDLAQKLKSLAAEVKIEEVRYAEETAKSGENHFAAIDKIKGRLMMSENSSKPITGVFQFENAGRKYDSEWGAPDKRVTNPESGNNAEVVFFDAFDADTNENVIVEAVRDVSGPKGEKLADNMPWSVTEVYEKMQDDGSRDMRGKPSARDVAQLTEDGARQITGDLRGELARHGLEGKVTVRAVRNLVKSSSAQTQGTFGFSKDTGAAGIEVRAGAAAGEIGVMRHEIIHALRSESLWGKPYGVFTETEWKALVRAAMADRDIRSSVESQYGDQPASIQTEEMVAEAYRKWAAARDAQTTTGRVFAKVMAFLKSTANALRGRGFTSAASVMEKVANGTVGGRGNPDPSGPKGGKSKAATEAREMRFGGTVREKFAPFVGTKGWKDAGQVVDAALKSKFTDAMASKGISPLSLVPARALFSELGKAMPSARQYLRTKDEMDTTRNDWHAEAATVAEKWSDLQKSDPAQNEDLMDLMHRSTLAGIDPSKDEGEVFKPNNLLTSAEESISRYGQDAPDWAINMVESNKQRRRSYASLREKFDMLSPEFKDMFAEVRVSYSRMADDFDKALEDNMKMAAKMALKRAEKDHRKALSRIKDDGLTGDERAEAVAEADLALAKAKKRNMMGVNSRIKSMRKVFEGNRLKGPYFPLSRFGDFWVAIRNENGEAINFSRFKTSAEQQKFAAEQDGIDGQTVSYGLLEDKSALRDQVDPKFVADIEALMGEAGVDGEIMDAVWQRYLSSLPDKSVRKGSIHRKGRMGWERDALRSYTSHMFHGAHQLTRLRYGLALEDALDEAADSARMAKDPNRATALVNEMRRRLDWTMNPTGSSWSAAASSLAFVWYLGATPAAALANMSQTTVMGPAIFKARFKKSSVGSILSEFGKASKDFAKGRGAVWYKDQWSVDKSPNITPDELMAMKEGYRRGTIDKTQSHDLASVAESGIEFNATREKWMRRVGFFFHHAERFNREVTFLAGYRIARAEGESHMDAVETAADLTWKTHFSYQNSDRPRVMQGDWPKLFLQFRQYSVNLLYRLFRDAHQSLKGATAEERKEARTQLVGITLSMMAHAGIKGTWGYGLLMGLLALFFKGDEDDVEEWMQDAMLMEGDSAGVSAWNFAMGAALNGAIGQTFGVSLSERIGSPNLWFRGSDRDLEKEDLLVSYVHETLGPTFGIAAGAARGVDYLARGETVRGIENLTPKFIRDVIRAGRYGFDGVTTLNGDELIQDVTPWEMLMQANGFTPARVAERYEVNTRLKNKEQEIVNERKGIHRAAGDAIDKGGLNEAVMEKIRDFNRRFPEYPITSETISQSYASRKRSHARSEGGITLNPKLEGRLRDSLAPSIYN